MSSRNQAALNSVSALVCAILFVTLAVLMLASTCQKVSAMQLTDGDSRSSPAASLAVVENPEITVRVLDNLLRSIVLSATNDPQSFSSNGARFLQKRGLDLGISRGFSGSQAGKHLMGLSAASFANGPGRK